MLTSELVSHCLHALFTHHALLYRVVELASEILGDSPFPLSTSLFSCTHIVLPLHFIQSSTVTSSKKPAMTTSYKNTFQFLTLLYFSSYPFLPPKIYVDFSLGGLHIPIRFQKVSFMRARTLSVLLTATANIQSGT